MQINNGLRFDREIKSQGIACGQGLPAWAGEIQAGEKRQSAGAYKDYIFPASQILLSSIYKMGFIKRRHPRIGVYICHCGENISSVVDVSSVRKYAETLPNVVVARENRYTCSDLGQSKIARDIGKHDLDRVVVASCSPRLHEVTFRQVLDSSGLNPYLFEMVNIREQCSWVHEDSEKATEKAKDLVRAAVARSSLLEPIEQLKKDVTKSVAVIGAGVAGITTAMYLAQAGIETHLVEKEPSIGGHMSQLDKTYPTLDCSLCILSPKMVDVRKEPNIELYAYSEIVGIQGHIGDFQVKIKQKPRYVDSEKCIACGQCSEVCPVEVDDEYNRKMSKRKNIYLPFPQAVPNTYLIDEENCLHLQKGGCQLCVEECSQDAIDFNQKEDIKEINVGAIVVATGFEPVDVEKITEYGYGEIDNVFTNLDFERILNADGPTKGKILTAEGEKPESIAFIQCVGSRCPENPYCSVICCMTTLKHAMLIKEKEPEIDVYVYFNDMRAGGKEFEEFYSRARKKGIQFLRGIPPEIKKDPATGRIIIRSEDIDAGKLIEKQADMVVLAAGMKPSSDVHEIIRELHLNYSPDGFLMEAHPKMRPVDTNIGGVFLAGCAQFPKGIPSVVSQAGNAAMGAAEVVLKDEIPIEETTAYVQKEKCTGCGMCVEVCPYEALKITEEQKVEVNKLLCKGCGACAVTCPSAAIQQRHFLDSQIKAQVEALLGVSYV